MGDVAVARDPIRILIAEDQRFVADALQAMLGQEPGMVVVGIVGSVTGSLPSVEILQPHVVILEFRVADENIAAVRTIQESSAAKVILLTSGDTEDITAAIEAGASAVLDLSTSAAEVIQAVRAVAEGGTFVAPRTIASLLKRRRSTDGRRDKLTTRERQVLSLMSEGTSNRAIAIRMGISYTTVRSHLRNVSSKLAAHSKLEILVKAQRLQLVDGKAPARVSFG